MKQLDDLFCLLASKQSYKKDLGSDLEESLYQNTSTILIPLMPIKWTDLIINLDDDLYKGYINGTIR